MGKFEEKADGFYVLEAKVGIINICKVFQEVNIPLENISKEPKTDGFFLNIPDITE